MLVLCVGNVCRSPLAAALLARALPGLPVWSAGLLAPVGRPADTLAITVAREAGLDLAAHRARQFAPWMAQAAELVLVMEPDQRQYLEQRLPQTRGRVALLSQYADGAPVRDPHGQSRPAFDVAFAHIERSVQAWAPFLRDLAVAPRLPDPADT